MFVFFVFSGRISGFHKKRISRISLWKTSHRSAKIAPNAYPDTSTEASGCCLNISPSNIGRWGQKMSGIGLGVMKYMYFGPEIGLCALLYKMAVQKVQILVTKTHFASTLGHRPSKFTPTLDPLNGLIGSPNGLVGCPNGLVGSPNGMERSPNGLVGSSNGLVGSTNGLAGSPNGLVGSPNSLVVSPSCLVRCPNGLVGSPNDLVRYRMVW